MRNVVLLVVGLLASASLPAGAAPPADGGTPAAPPSRAEADTVYQFFLPDGDGNSGAYLWVPPGAKTIHGIILGIHNGLPAPILRDPGVRREAAEFDLAEVLLTPNGSRHIGPVMLKGLNFDFTDPEKTAVFDGIIKGLADLSGHPELVNAPLLPLAHSAYMDVPFDIALRDNEKCIAIIPIKSGVPDKYAFYRAGGKSKAPAPERTLANVPILYYQGLVPETVPGMWKTAPFPYPGNVMGTAGLTGAYRRDTDDNPGTDYRPQDDLAGAYVDVCSGHFDMLPRDAGVIATFIRKACRRRLPHVYPADPNEKPRLKPVDLASGWLVDMNYQNAGAAGKAYYPPAPYLDYKGPRKNALWFLDEEMAKGVERLMVTEYRKKFEVFTVRLKDGSPLSIAETPLPTLPDANDWFTDDCVIRLPVYPFRRPPDICTVTAKGHDREPGATHEMRNVLFPGATSLPVSDLPVLSQTFGGLLEPAGDCTFRVRPSRLWPEPGGFNMNVVNLYKEGDAEFAASIRNVIVSTTLNSDRELKDQTVTFPEIPDVAAAAQSVELKATSTSGFPVGYFVRQGPAVVEGNRLVITQLPDVARYPITVTVGAYQVGRRGAGGFKPSATVYRSFRIER